MDVRELLTEQMFIVIKITDITDIGDIRIKALPYIIITIITNSRELQSLRAPEFSKTFYISAHIGTDPAF
jgi:hypothetical protein